MQSSADVVICGAGIAGAAAAYHLAVTQQFSRVVLVDEREPFTLTSDKGTQGYRNWWPGPDDTMFKFVSRSIDLLEESARENGNVFRMNRRGYLFATADEDQMARLAATAHQVSGFGMGPVRMHRSAATYAPAPSDGFEEQPIGADLLTGEQTCGAFPFLAPDTLGAVHVRRAGTLNAVALGNWMITRAVAAGAQFVRGRVSAVATDGGRVREVRLADGSTIATDRFVIAAGPALHQVGRLLGLDLPVVHELHSKITIRDSGRAVPRDAPFVIWTDPVTVGGKALPGGVHMRPVDLAHGSELYLIWTYETDVRPYVWPPSFDARYPDVVLEGSARMIPAMSAYAGTGSTALLDGGYYCKTRENRPLIGPLPVEGAFVVGALSGMGVMSAHACGELVSAHVAGTALPDYARWFLPSRYDDPQYRALVEEWGPLVGQL
ncbi:MAG: dependent oxidoreductase [Gemmatimonadetes bacterium]|nr:dependent oxidoreductase [Gemmatimonadota bacterium]